MRAAAGVVQPVPGLLVGPARNCEVRRRGGNRLAGTDGNTPMRARRRFEAITVAASAEAHKVINRPRAKTDRIALFQSISRYPLVMCARAAGAKL